MELSRFRGVGVEGTNDRTTLLNLKALYAGPGRDNVCRKGEEPSTKAPEDKKTKKRRVNKSRSAGGYTSGGRSVPKGLREVEASSPALGEAILAV